MGGIYKSPLYMYIGYSRVEGPQATLDGEERELGYAPGQFLHFWLCEKRVMATFN